MDKRATCLNCMDGRVQLPVINWIREHNDIAFVDVITEAGMDGVLSSQTDIQEVLRSINVSVTMNKSQAIFIVGHYDCRGNPTDDASHQEQIRKSVRRIKAVWPTYPVTGLWVNNEWKVEVILTQ